MNRNAENIKKELKSRGLKEISKEDINTWALILAIEDLTNEIKKPFMIKGIEKLID